MTKILHRKDLEKSLDFEIELALITEPAENRRNMTQRYNPTTMGSAKSYPGLPDSWTSYVGGLLSIGGVDIGDVESRAKTLRVGVGESLEGAGLKEGLLQTVSADKKE